ncbi:MAG: GNAT family N-acetyltransferase [Kofleriaceae bacterium]
MTLRIERVTGRAIERHLDALAALRIAVFREFPYLYEGSLEYEQRYLARYAHSDAAVIVLALDDERVVGASTAMPLVDHSDDAVPPLVRAGYDPATVYYFGESVLDPAYRGRGLGVAFFEQREQRARELGFRTAAFCAVERPADHPRRPANYRPHDRLWTRRGFVRRAEITTTFSWRDLDEAADSPKQMVFWIKELE